MLLRPAYSSDLSQYDFWMFPRLKETMKWKTTVTKEEKLFCVAVLIWAEGLIVHSFLCGGILHLILLQ
jgi:hypothetical protein